jgi:hypothetical protein
MWIKWKYNDHGWPDFAELEIPDEALREYDTEEESIIMYIIDNCNIPTWGERYMSGRIKWMPYTKTPEELKKALQQKIEGLRFTIRRDQDKLNQLIKKYES